MLSDRAHRQGEVSSRGGVRLHGSLLWLGESSKTQEIFPFGHVIDFTQSSDTYDLG